MTIGHFIVMLLAAVGLVAVFFSAVYLVLFFVIPHVINCSKNLRAWRDRQQQLKWEEKVRWTDIRPPLTTGEYLARHEYDDFEDSPEWASLMRMLKDRPPADLHPTK